LHLRTLYEAGGDPTSMTTDDQRYVQILSDLMENREVDNTDFRWFDEYGVCRYPDAAQQFLLDATLRQKRQVKVELQNLREDIEKYRKEASEWRLRSKVESKVEFARFADMAEDRRAASETQIPLMEQREREIDESLVILQRVCGQSMRGLDDHDQQALGILVRLAGLRGAAQQGLTKHERLFLDAYRDRYGFEVALELEQRYALTVG
jgi:hypothetical protein